MALFKAIIQIHITELWQGNPHPEILSKGHERGRELTVPALLSQL